MKIALIGGTGSFGMALAVRLREAGYEVVIGSRDAERARATADRARGRGRDERGCRPRGRRRGR